MMKNRSFLFGLGTGLIAGALLLQLMISGGAAPLTKEQVLQGAEKLNLKVLDESAEAPSDEAALDDADQDQKTDGLTDGSQENVAPSEPALAASPSPVVSPTVSDNPNKVIPPKEPSTPKEGTVEKPEVTTAPTAVTPVTPKVTANAGVFVRIPSGSTLTETADILEKAAVIKDKEIFLQAANKHEINKKIQSGSYNFNKDESLDSIIEKLISFQ
ncbi:endolytic transglycosylase MltG [Paenibacillus sp.]|uniref:endolytic transglycosylase MltG n=1 Tax=Paenibacillus sp. TaxID=58172 RepID=UPI0028A587B7|nr:endolytic transglycosylase MltG [Paenibacillus sp.]